MRICGAVLAFSMCYSPCYLKHCAISIDSMYIILLIKLFMLFHVFYLMLLILDGMFTINQAIYIIILFCYFNY